jgi:glycosyltransferase involved in cell wall biosynthesis
MKILHLISSGGMYGAEVMLLNLASAQKRLGCEPVIGVFENTHQPHMELAKAASDRGLAVEVLPCRGKFDRKTIGSIRRSIRASSACLVHGHGYKSDLYGFLSAKPMGVRFVATCHLWTRASRSIRFYEYLDSLILRRADRVVGVSDGIAECLRKSGIPQQKISVIYNGTDLPATIDCQPTLRQEIGAGNKLIVGTVGRLEEQKGLEYFIAAAKEVLTQFPGVLFVVAGEGSWRSRLEHMISDLGLTSSVLLLGRRTDMAGVYASLDLFVLASIDEGMPMTILEALATRRTVVATSVGAVEKLIIPERTGMLVEPRNVPALRDAMLRCLRDPSSAQELGHNGEEHVRNSFSSDAMAGSYIALYRRVLSELETNVATSVQEA